MRQVADSPAGPAQDQPPGLLSDGLERWFALAAMAVVVAAAYAVAYVVDRGSSQPWSMGDRLAWWGAMATWLALIAGLGWKLRPERLKRA
jgi:hypothetical protein